MSKRTTNIGVGVEYRDNINRIRTTTIGLMMEYYSDFISINPSGSFASASCFSEIPDVFIIEYVVPQQDSLTGTWTNELGNVTNLYQSIDDTSVNDLDYIESVDDPSDDIYKTKIETVSDPNTDELHQIYYRYRKSAAGGSLHIRVRLLQGSTEIASWTHTGISTDWVTQTQSLSTGQVGQITDYSDLYLEIKGYG